MKKILLALSIVLVLTVTQANAAPFGFAADPGFNITQGYQGFNYGGGFGTSSWVNDTVDSIDSYFGIGPTVLGAAWSDGGVDLTLMSSVPGNMFDLGSLSLNIGSTLNVTIQGLVNGSVVDSWTGQIHNGYVYTDVTLNWTGIEQVNLSTGGGANLFVTNIDTSQSSVPVPATLLLFSSGLLGLAGVRKKLKK